jgi:tetratricopeptide (TPR) repeat protein
MREIFNDIHTLELSSLDAVFERSWVLLTPAEQTGFMQLSIFNTPFTHQAAREVAQVDLALFTSLVDKSLIQRTSSTAGVEDAQDTVNFALHPLLKQFAHHKLIREPELLEHVQESHANYFLSMADSLDKSILGPDVSLAIKKIHTLHEDIFAAMKWGCTHTRYESIRKGLHIHSHYFEYYCAFRLGKYLFGEFVHILREIKRQQKHPSNALDQILARAIAYYGWHVMRSGEYQDALEHEREAVQLARESGEVCMEAGALNAIGVIHDRLGDLDLSNQFYKHALEAAKRAEGQLEGRWYVAGIYYNLGDNALTQSKLDLAEEYFDNALEHNKEIGHYWGILDAHLAYGKLYMQQGNYEKARISLQEGLALAESNNYVWLRNRSLVRLGDLAFKQEDWETAVRYYQESFDSTDEFGHNDLLEKTRAKLEESNRMIRSR